MSGFSAKSFLSFFTEAICCFSGSRWLLRITELRRSAFPALRLGMVKGVSKVPTFPSPFSLATKRRVYLPGASVKPVSY